MTTTSTRMAAAAALTVIVTLGVAPVAAQTLQLDLNNGRIGVAPDRYERERGPVIIERERYGISCGDGSRIVRQNGFRDVRPIDCGGRAFTYSALRRGEPVEVRVSARDGRIVAIERF